MRNRLIQSLGMYLSGVAAGIGAAKELPIIAMCGVAGFMFLYEWRYQCEVKN